MTIRIKELIAEAQVVVGHTDGGYTEVKALDPSKFAELIILECAGLVEIGMIEVNQSDADITTVLNTVLKHFGLNLITTLTKNQQVRIVKCEGNQYACELIGRIGTVLGTRELDVVVQVGTITWVLHSTDVEAI